MPQWGSRFPRSVRLLPRPLPLDWFSLPERKPHSVSAHSAIRKRPGTYKWNWNLISLKLKHFIWKTCQTDFFSFILLFVLFCSILIYRHLHAILLQLKRSIFPLLKTSLFQVVSDLKWFYVGYLISGKIDRLCEKESKKDFVKWITPLIFDCLIVFSHKLWITDLLYN